MLRMISCVSVLLMAVPLDAGFYPSPRVQLRGNCTTRAWKAPGGRGLAWSVVMKVCIDASHGGTDPGAAAGRPSPLVEKAFTLGLARALEAECVRRGHRVLMTRRSDRTLSLLARAA